MVDEDVAKDGKLRVQRRHFSKVGLERGAEPAQRRRRVQLADLPFDLFRHQLALEICRKSPGALALVQQVISTTRFHEQCSCLPVNDCPGGGMEAADLARTGSSRAASRFSMPITASARLEGSRAAAEWDDPAIKGKYTLHTRTACGMYMTQTEQNANTVCTESGGVVNLRSQEVKTDPRKAAKLLL
jgi:hypothetical protein